MLCELGLSVLVDLLLRKVVCAGAGWVETVSFGSGQTGRIRYHGFVPTVTAPQPSLEWYMVSM